ncbi:hypothetical protein RFI_18938 [Reticulomyxa filosa]|uniref:Aminoacyl-tRNA synthetase class II (G/ P/ S/T) domain-containing protein n=1 Tax=Reticulomyxa filosa TaxID=46433 RepID=X6MXX7_RETFI|nr:hypothetical protein RFI_18938 [Reticulomyxa filosa]|eukprot:ETO18337.1 hypothetical protein RFI_18938 [Reticulomyxa filosa]
MLQVAEEFYQSLNIPYHVVNIISGELNNAAAKKYDLEGWFPTLGHYRELVSCSNCTDYQARGMETRFGFPKMNEREKQYVHMLNASLSFLNFFLLVLYRAKQQHKPQTLHKLNYNSALVATTRTLCCILENYQTDDGVRVPEALQPYMNGAKFLPFVKPPPEDKDKKETKKNREQSSNLNLDNVVKIFNQKLGNLCRNESQHFNFVSEISDQNKTSLKLNLLLYYIFFKNFLRKKIITIFN